MAEPRKAAVAPRKGRRQTPEPDPPATAARPARLAFTLDIDTGRIIRIEGVDAEDVRHELSAAEKIEIARNASPARIDALLREAFEAGIACVLGGEDQDEFPELPDDDELRQIILKPLMEDSPAARLLQRDVLDRAIVETLIQMGLTPQHGEPSDGLVPDQDPDRSASPGPTA